MRNLRILLVEDDAISRKIYSKMLGNWGYEVHYANDGYLALQMVEDQHYDLLLTDNQLPFMNGTDLIKKAKILRPDIGVMLLTGDDISQKFAGQYTVLQKPVMPSFLKFQIETTISNLTLKQTA